MLSNTKQGAADDDNVLVVPLLGLTENAGILSDGWR
jgi:hypothetical protein